MVQHWQPRSFSSDTASRPRRLYGASRWTPGFGFHVSFGRRRSSNHAHGVACFGELIQIDGCEHRWFEHRAPMCTALVYVDDAASRLMVVRFAGSASTFSYFEMTLKYLQRFGKPLAFYSDKASIFRINQPGASYGTRLHAVRPGALRA